MTSPRPIPPRIMLVAGEASGDLLGAALARALHALRPDAVLFGLGGPHMAAAGVVCRRGLDGLAVMGISEVLARLPFFLRLKRQVLDWARQERPDVLVTIDYPGFNIRLAAAARRQGLRTVHYVCPQVWAWKAGRIPRIARTFDRLLTLFPFEPACFKGTGLRVDFVGHPLADEIRAHRAGPLLPLPWGGAGPRVALLPGSRPHEIARMLPVLVESAGLILQSHPASVFMIPVPGPDDVAPMRERLRNLQADPARFAIAAGGAREVLRQARAALVASGTATLEAGLMRCPLVVTYRVSALTAWVARRVLRIPFIGLVNIVAGREICPERLQDRATPMILADELRPLLDETPTRAAMLKELEAVEARLGAVNAAERAARSILDEITLALSPSHRI